MLHTSPAKRLARHERTPAIQSLDRGLLIIEIVAKSHHPVALADLAELLSIDRSSAFRLATTLRRRGFLASPDGRKDYVLGPSIWRLARQRDWSATLAMLSHRYLKQLSAQTGETVHLAVQEGRNALFIDHVTPNNIIVVSGQTGELVPLHSTAHGKALLADLDKTRRAALLGAGPLKACTGQTIVRLDQLEEACSRIKAQGYATDDGEFLEGIRCVAAAIRDRDGAVIGSVGISAPLVRFPEERYSICGEQVSKVAGQISNVLSQVEDKSKP